VSAGEHKQRREEKREGVEREGQGNSRKKCHTPVPLPSVTRCNVKYSNGHIRLFGFQSFVKRYEEFLGSGNFWKILQV